MSAVTTLSPTPVGSLPPPSQLFFLLARAAGLVLVGARQHAGLRTLSHVLAASSREGLSLAITTHRGSARRHSHQGHVPGVAAC